MPMFSDHNYANKPSQIPVVRTFIIYIIAFLLCVHYCRVHSYRDPGSAFFDPDRAFVQWYTAHRSEEARDFTAQAALSAKLDHGRPHPKARYVKAGRKPRVCATFITVKRDIPQQYIDLSIGSFLDGLTAAERADVHLKVFFPQLDPSKHPTWHEGWLSELVDDAYAYSDTMPAVDIEQAKNLTNMNNFVEKAILDYRTALGHCLKTTSAQWIAIFEDDVVFAESWLARSIQALEMIEKKGGDWLYLRLFNQERSTAWKVNEPLIALLISAGLCAFLILLRRNSRFIRKRLDNPTLALTCFLAAPAFVILFFKAGKATMLPPKPGVRQESFGCCSQGLVFPRRQVLDLMEYLRLVEVHKTDLLINSFSRTNHLARFSLYPVMMQHIGTKTSQPTKDISAAEPRAVWSMAFENLNSLDLQIEHAEMVEQLYGKDAWEKSIYL